jgi:hypothetical protein
VTGPKFGMIPRRVAKLRLSRRVHAVLDVIACHARGGTALLLLKTISDEAGIDRSKVCFCIRVLRKLELVEVMVQGGGRGRASVYRIITDEEALARTADAAVREPENVAVSGNISGLETLPILALNVADFGLETLPILATPIERRTESLTEKGTESARAENARQTNLLLPINTEPPAAREGLEKNEGQPSWRCAPSASNAVSEAVKARKKEQLQQKLSRFLQATGGDVVGFWAVQAGDDKAAAQRLLDQVDRRMRARNWDDTREWQGRA